MNRFGTYGIAVPIALVLVISFSVPASSGAEAVRPEVDGSFAFASGPGSYNGGFGLTFGAGIPLESVTRNLEARFDLGYFQFKQDFAWGKGSYTRIPFTFSARYYFPLANQVRLFGQAGLEMSVDSFDNAADRRQNDVNLGISPAAGVDISVTPAVSIFALARAHLISDNYLSMQFGAAMHF